MSHLKALAAASLLAITTLTAAHAADAPAPPWSLDINVTSIHTEAWARRELNQVNPGLGLEYQASPDWGAAVGYYRNSYRRTSVYALGIWTPLHLAIPGGLTASAGLAAGLVSGYTRTECPVRPQAQCCAFATATVSASTCWPCRTRRTAAVASLACSSSSRSDFATR